MSDEKIPEFKLSDRPEDVLAKAVEQFSAGDKIHAFLAPMGYRTVQVLAAGDKDHPLFSIHVPPTRGAEIKIHQHTGNSGAHVLWHRHGRNYRPGHTVEDRSELGAIDKLKKIIEYSKEIGCHEMVEHLKDHVEHAEVTPLNTSAKQYEVFVELLHHAHAEDVRAKQKWVAAEKAKVRP